jgi:acetoin utilization protein AcuB
MHKPNASDPIRIHMTHAPHSIGRDQKLAAAHAKMRELGIRHLPVLEGGKLAGVLSQRDLYFVEALDAVDTQLVRVEEAMSQDVYAVGPDTKLGDVVAKMLEHKYGCAVIVENGSVRGIFTTVDALRLLVSLLKK